MFNNFAYVIMLSAAHDLLKEEEGGDGDGDGVENGVSSHVDLTVLGQGKDRFNYKTRLFHEGLLWRIYGCCAQFYETQLCGALIQII
jgi:hypothetical protein